MTESVASEQQEDEVGPKLTSQSVDGDETTSTADIATEIFHEQPKAQESQSKHDGKTQSFWKRWGKLILIYKVVSMVALPFLFPQQFAFMESRLAELLDPFLESHANLLTEILQQNQQVRLLNANTGLDLWPELGLWREHHVSAQIPDESEQGEKAIHGAARIEQQTTTDALDASHTVNADDPPQANSVDSAEQLEDVQNEAVHSEHEKEAPRIEDMQEASLPEEVIQQEVVHLHETPQTEDVPETDKPQDVQQALQVEDVQDASQPIDQQESIHVDAPQLEEAPPIEKASDAEDEQDVSEVEDEQAAAQVENVPDEQGAPQGEEAQEPISTEIEHQATPIESAQEAIHEQVSQDANAIEEEPPAPLMAPAPALAEEMDSAIEAEQASKDKSAHEALTLIAEAEEAIDAKTGSRTESRWWLMGAAVPLAVFVKVLL
jgi:hypothetical protein